MARGELSRTKRRARSLSLIGDKGCHKASLGVWGGFANLELGLGPGTTRVRVYLAKVELSAVATSPHPPSLPRYVPTPSPTRAILQETSQNKVRQESVLFFLFGAYSAVVGT